MHSCLRMLFVKALINDHQQAATAAPATAEQMEAFLFKRAYAKGNVRAFKVHAFNAMNHFFSPLYISLISWEY